MPTKKPLEVVTKAPATTVAPVLPAPPTKRPPTVRLIRNIAPEDLNELLADLESRGFWVMNVLAREVFIRSKRGEESLPIYDVLVSGEESPFWNVWGDNFHG